MYKYWFFFLLSSSLWLSSLDAYQSEVVGSKFSDSSKMIDRSVEDKKEKPRVQAFSSSSVYMHWQDPPISGYNEIVGEEVPEVELLMKEYHKIPKDIKECISARKSILFVAANQLKCYDTNPAARLLQKQILAKAAYLNALENFPTHEEIIQHHSSQNPNALTLRNNITYSLKMHEYWGGFWLESIDPCHRRLAHYYVIWKQQNPECTDYLSFFLWLETQYIPPSNSR